MESESIWEIEAARGEADLAREKAAAAYWPNTGDADRISRAYEKAKNLTPGAYHPALRLHERNFEPGPELPFPWKSAIACFFAHRGVIEVWQYQEIHSWTLPPKAVRAIGVGQHFDDLLVGVLVHEIGHAAHAALSLGDRQVAHAAMAAKTKRWLRMYISAAATINGSECFAEIYGLLHSPAWPYVSPRVRNFVLTVCANVWRPLLRPAV